MRIHPGLAASSFVGLLACAPVRLPHPDKESRPDSATDTETPGPLLARAANNRDYLPAALEILDAATERVSVIEYVMYDEPEVREILDAVARAASRGATCRFLADEVGSQTAGLLDELRAAGVDARFDAPTRTTHNKLILADGRSLVGSTNLTGDAIRLNNEANVLLDDPAATASYLAYFEALWADPAREAKLTASASGPIQPLLERQVLDGLRGCLAGAGSRIDVLLYAIAWSDEYTDSPVNALVLELVAARERGLDVRVALDNSAWIDRKDINARAVEILLEGGVELRLTPASTTTHAKMVSCDDVVVVSDANWSYGALQLYHSTGVAITSGDLAGVYREWFNSIWATSTAP